MGTEPRINPDVVKQVDEAAQHWAAKHAPITVNVENLPAVELCMKRLADLGGFLDRLHDEAFPDDPYLLGRLHAEMERLGYATLRGSNQSVARAHRHRSQDDG